MRNIKSFEDFMNEGYHGGMPRVMDMRLTLAYLGTLCWYEDLELKHKREIDADFKFPAFKDGEASDIHDKYPNGHIPQRCVMILDTDMNMEVVEEYKESYASAVHRVVRIDEMKLLEFMALAKKTMLENDQPTGSVKWNTKYFLDDVFKFMQAVEGFLSENGFDGKCVFELDSGHQSVFRTTMKDVRGQIEEDPSMDAIDRMMKSLNNFTATGGGKSGEYVSRSFLGADKLNAAVKLMLSHDDLLDAKWKASRDAMDKFRDEHGTN